MAWNHPQELISICQTHLAAPSTFSCHAIPKQSYTLSTKKLKWMTSFPKPLLKLTGDLKKVTEVLTHSEIWPTISVNWKSKRCISLQDCLGVKIVPLLKLAEGGLSKCPLIVM